MSRQPDIDPVVRATIPFGLHLLGPALSKLLDDASNELERDNDAARRCLARAERTRRAASNGAWRASAVAGSPRAGLCRGSSR
jgi:hypothetical protein